MFKKIMVKDKVFFKGGTAGAIILIIILTSVVYASSLKNSFVWDDYHVIVDNDFIKSWKSFPAIFSRDYLLSGSMQDYFTMRNTGSGQLTYRPLITIFHFIDYSLWKLRPFGYHLTNLLLHISNVILLYFLIGLIAKDRRIAGLTSALFALHPVNSEAVNVITFRGDLLVFLFFISSFILFIKLDYCDRRRRIFCYFASFFLFLLALFSKEAAVTLPLLLIVYDYYFIFNGELKKIFSCFKSRYIGYMVLTLFYLWVWSFPMGNINIMVAEYPGGNFYTNLLTMSRVITVYIKWLFIPIGIHATLPYDSSYFLYSFFTPAALFSVSLVIACIVLGLALFRKSRLLSFAIIWFFITLLPVSNIVPISNIMACRYLYIPAAGFCFLIAILLSNRAALRIPFISAGILEKVTRVSTIAVLIFYSAFTIIRNFAWRNSATVWLEVAEHYPDNPLPHRNLGVWFMGCGLLDKAIDEFKIAISLDPAFVIAYQDLGLCYYNKELLDEAIGEFEKALKLGLNQPEIYINLGACLIGKKQYREAIDYIQEAIKTEPMSTKAYYNLGVAYANMKNYTEAKKTWEKALEINPEFKDAKDNLKKLEQLKVSGELFNYVKNKNDKK